MFSFMRKLFRSSGENQESTALRRFNLIETAELAHARGDYRKAVKYFTQLIKDRSLPPPETDQLWTWYLNRGLALRAIGRRQEALSDYQRAAELNPTSHKPHLNAGIILGQDFGRHEEALTEFNDALELNSKDVDTLSALGSTELALGNIIAAEAHYRVALSTQPNNADAIYNLGNIYLLHKHQPQEAVALYRQALKLKPRDSEINNNLNIALGLIKLIETHGYYVVNTCTKCGLRFYAKEAGATGDTIYCPKCSSSKIISLRI